MKTFEDIRYQNVNITGGFWQNRQKINAEVTSYSVYNRFSDSHRYEALDCSWKEGMNYHPHIFWDSDVAKWIEGAAYIIAKADDICYDQADAKKLGDTLSAMCDNAIATIAKNQTEEGYFNSHYLVMNQDERFKHRSDHELYCAGHLMEAACAYYEATGKDLFLKVMCKYADYIYDTFFVYQTASFTTCGHPEIELALVRLSETTKNEKYLKLAKFFVDKHGNNQKDHNITSSCNKYYAQDHLPLKEQRTAEGHCVRAMYLYSAMADIAKHYDDDEYLESCLAIFNNVLNYKMYITGGIGSAHLGESFATDYYLPNDVAYTETCAAISLALFCKRLQQITVDPRLADTIERIIYNGFLSGVSLDGKSFFYENPLEIDPFFSNVNTSTTVKRHVPIMERVELFNCSCCPPNVLRFIASIGEFLYTYNEDTLFVHQYMASETRIRDTVILQETHYPAHGAVKISVKGSSFKRIAVRIPGWCTSFTSNTPCKVDNGYAYFENTSEDVKEIQMNFEMPVVLYEANEHVQNNAGCAAVTRGPVVYCMEEADNGKYLNALSLPGNSSFELAESQDYMVPVLKTKGHRKSKTAALYQPYSASVLPVDLTFIPYFAFSNRGANEMRVWVRVTDRIGG